MFEIYTKEVEIKSPNGEMIKYKLRPLAGRFLPLLYAVVNKMQKQSKGLESLTDDERSEKAFDSFDEETTGKLHTLVFESLKATYPDKDANELDQFASQNLMQFFGALIEVNLGNGTE